MGCILLWFDVCWCYVVVWLGWCGIRMQVDALVFWFDVCWCYFVVWLGWCGIRMQVDALVLWFDVCWYYVVVCWVGVVSVCRLKH